METKTPNFWYITTQENIRLLDNDLLDVLDSIIHPNEKWNAVLDALFQERTVTFFPFLLVLNNPTFKAGITFSITIDDIESFMIEIPFEDCSSKDEISIYCDFLFASFGDMTNNSYIVKEFFGDEFAGIENVTKALKL